MGLLSGAARLARAVDQGYDFDNVMYHASKQDIKEFKPGYDDGLVFLTPSKEFANNWLGKGKFQERQGGTGAIEGVKAEIKQLRKEADEIMESLPDDQASQYYREVFDPKRSRLLREERLSDSAIYPVVTKTKKPFVPSKDFDVLEELFGEERFNAPFGSGFPKYKDALKDGNYLLYENKEVVDFLKSKGYDSMFLKESSGEAQPFTTLAVFEPSDIRSVNAQFDPNNKDSSKILSSAAPITAGLLGAGALGSSDEAQAGPTGLLGRLGRASDQGFDNDQTWYHGSTHDIEQMRPDLLNPESHFGKGYYLTTSPADASKNYAGMGPDLTQRIQTRAEQIANDLDVDYDDPKALEQATEELKGQSDGVIYPVITRSQKTFDISSDGDTFLDYKLPDLDPEDYLDEADGDIDLAKDLASDDSFNYEPEGDLVEFINSIANDPRIEGDDAQKLVAAIQDTAFEEGGIKGTDLDRIMRKTEFFATDYDTGQMVNNEVYRQALENAGFDSVVHDGDIFLNVSFNKNIEPGTKHKIVFAPENIRSINAEFDPEKTQSSNLLASPAPAAIGAGLLATSAQPTTRDKAIAAGEVARQAMGGLLATPGAALQTIIQATTNDAPTSQLEANFERMASRPEFQPQTQLGRQYSEAAQKGLLDVMRGPLAAGSAIVEPLSEAASLLPRRARLVGRSLLDLL